MKEITIAMLRKHESCKNQVGLFQKTFGERAEITIANALKAFKIKLNIFWLERSLSSMARKKYKKDIANAWEKYDKDYNKAKTNKAIASAKAKYDRAVVSALVKALRGEETTP